MPPSPQAYARVRPRYAPGLFSLVLAAVCGAAGMWAWLHGGSALVAPDGPFAEVSQTGEDASDLFEGMPAVRRLLPRREAQAKASYAHGVTTVPLHKGVGGFYAPVTVDGVVTADFVIDSGATQVCLSAEMARALMRAGKLTPADFRGGGGAILADGSRVPARIYNLRSLKVGGRELKNVSAVVQSGHGPGQLLLGQNVLRRFKSWSIDNRRRVLLLQD
jgi:clan AA aspartic protease (TIGR02281 family)